MSQLRSRTVLTLLPLAIALAALLAVYLPTLQRIPNGSEHYYMIDVGETQVVLNIWGTLHATGYPLYVMIGNTVVTILKAFGVGPAAAPGVVSLMWGLAALVALYALALKIRCRPILAAGMVVLFGLTRTVWIHHVIAEVYTMTLFLLLSLLLLALWQPPVHGRLYWLALIGGIGVAHHRAIALAIPALLYAVYPDLIALIRRRPHHLILLLLLGMIGLMPYGYLMLRANAGVPWVYGEPGTLSGLWDQFMGREASRFIGAPTSLDGLIANIQLVTDVILTDVTVVGAALGILGLIVGAVNRRTRRAAITLILSGGAAYLFHCFFYTDILSALILATTLSLGLGWFLLADSLFTWIKLPVVGNSTPATPLAQSSPLTAADSSARTHILPSPSPLGSTPAKSQTHILPTPPLATGSQKTGQPGTQPTSHLLPATPPLLVVPSRSIIALVVSVGLAGAALISAVWLIGQNQTFIAALTSDRAGIDTIALAQHAPPGSTLMLAWGPRYFAVGFARSVMGALPGVELVDHKANFRAVLASGTLVTPAYTFYRQPESWWEEQIGGPIYLHAAAHDLVEIATTPERVPVMALPDDHPDGVTPFSYRLTCAAWDYVLDVAWLAVSRPTRDLSVFVHLEDENGTVIDQDDQHAPVYGWRPLTTWTQGEVVRDVYSLSRLPGAKTIRFGLYTQHDDGSFENILDISIPANCAS